MLEALNILILAGGCSEEREVSLASARAVTATLQKLGHRVKAIDPASGCSLLDERGRYLLEEDLESDSRISLKRLDSVALTTSIGLADHQDIDLVFLALHGGSGEDGTIQAILDIAGMKYTGSGMLASAISMNKAFAKRILRREKIPTPDWLLVKITDREDIAGHIPEIMKRFAFPLIVKPNNSGSTIGLTLVKKEIQLPGALADAADINAEVLIEQYIKGREITGSVLEGDALPLVEIIPSGDLYDYQCKYTKGKSQYVCPADIAADLTAEIQHLARRAYRLIGCSGLVRIDFILDQRNRPFFLEVNTLPGMTELSLAPMAAGEAGIDFDELVQRMCEAALEK
ncbi:MAG: D-alanine--D-alanine ligase [Candidatus Zixiibacteriota bacterium]|nr:MAG: D-alanine--D-alanine ligase [candidate division Zixibacteria bacterium]